MAGTYQTMTTIEDNITTTLLAKMLAEKGKWSAIVSASEVRTHTSRDLLLGESSSSFLGSELY